MYSFGDSCTNCSMQCFEELLQRRQTEIRFVNSPLSSLISELSLSLNAETISTTNANFACKSFIVTEFSFDNHAKKTWLACQGYFSEENPSAFDGNGRIAEDVTEREGLLAASNEPKLFCKKYLRLIVV